MKGKKVHIDITKEKYCRINIKEPLFKEILLNTKHYKLEKLQQCMESKDNKLWRIDTTKNWL